MYTNQKGFAHYVIVIALVLVLVIGGVAFRVATKESGQNHQTASEADVLKNREDKTPPDQKQNAQPVSQNPDITEANSEQIGKSSPVKIKHIGVNLGYYDPATNKAGDFVFTKSLFPSGFQMLFMEFGYVQSGANSSNGQAKANPQPTFILPLGSKVYSLIDGTVVNVPKLYSNDFSVHVKGEGSDLLFETEHVENVIVKVGDKVKAGQQVAQVSSYSTHSYNGLGLVEIGILRGGGTPYHVCTFDFLDDSIKAETFKKLTAFKKSWEEYRGDTSIYNEAVAVVPGCVSRKPTEG
jgi:biotin carboxyl carrier protein